MSYLTLVAEAGNSEVGDESIVARVVAGDTAAFETLVRRHNRRVFRAARAILKNDDEAEDVMQEAYVSAFMHLGDFGGRSRFSTWLVRIAVYEALGRLRRGKRLTSLDDPEMEEDPIATTRSPEGAASDVELRALLEAAVDALPVGFRTVFVLRAAEGMTVEETAEALDIPEETVRTRLHRARGLLRDRLAQQLESVSSRAFDFHLVRCDRITAAVLARIQSL
ncbi:MAG TPA: RNA polymerase sigma factor [Polyangiaceae bacterium]|nr:RNA polymerase sigma factor [Polyangiaceae bacterium]